MTVIAQFSLISDGIMLDKIWNVVNDAIMCACVVDIIMTEELCMETGKWNRMANVWLKGSPCVFMVCFLFIVLLWLGFFLESIVDFYFFFFFPSCEMRIPPNLCVYLLLLLGFSVGLEEVSSLLLTAGRYLITLFLITHFMNFQITLRDWYSDRLKMMQESIIWTNLSVTDCILAISFCLNHRLLYYFGYSVIKNIYWSLTDLLCAEQLSGQSVSQIRSIQSFIPRCALIIVRGVLKN